MPGGEFVGRDGGSPLQEVHRFGKLSGSPKGGSEVLLSAQQARVSPDGFAIEREGLCGLATLLPSLGEAQVELGPSVGIPLDGRSQLWDTAIEIALVDDLSECEVEVVDGRRWQLFGIVEDDFTAIGFGAGFVPFGHIGEKIAWGQAALDEMVCDDGVNDVFGAALRHVA